MKYIVEFRNPSGGGDEWFKWETCRTLEDAEKELESARQRYVRTGYEWRIVQE